MQTQRKPVETSKEVSSTRRYVFVLLERFSMLSFASAVECLRIANRMAGREVYSWTLLGEGGEQVTCSAGTTFAVDGDFGDLQRDDSILVCAGVNVQAATSKKLLAWLRREARKGVMIGGLCTASYVLAKAGLLDGKRQPSIGKTLIALPKSSRKLPSQNPFS